MTIDIEAIANIILTAFLTGIGVTIGTYFANRSLIKHMDKLIDKVKVGVNDRNKDKADKGGRLETANAD